MKALILAHLLFAPIAQACIPGIAQVTLSKTSLERVSIHVQSRTIIFNQGTGEESSIRFDSSLGGWCFSNKKDSTQGCIEGKRKASLTNHLGQKVANLVIDGKGQELQIIPVTGKEQGELLRVVPNDEDGLRVLGRLCENDRFAGCGGGTLDSWTSMARTITPEGNSGLIDLRDRGSFRTSMCANSKPSQVDVKTESEVLR